MFVRKPKRARSRPPKPQAKAEAAQARGCICRDGLEQRHLDLIGLVPDRPGVYLGFVLFFGWEGGKVGYGLETALELPRRRASARSDLATVLMLRRRRSMLVTGTSFSALARGRPAAWRRSRTASSDGEPGRRRRPSRIRAREARREARDRDALVETAGRARTDVMSALAAEDATTFEPTVALGRGRAEDDDDLAARPTDRLRRRAGGRARARGDGRSARRRSSDLDDPEPMPSRRSEVDGAEATASRSHGRQARGVTESDEIDYRPRPRSCSSAAKATRAPIRATTRSTGRNLLETLGHFGVEAKIVGIVSGPHVSRYELRLAPGHQGREGHRAHQRPRLRAGLDRHPHPGPDPRQAGRRRRGPERAPPHRPPRRHLRRPAREDLAARRLARQGHRRQAGLDRPGEDAARPRRRHHRLGQVRLRQRDPHLDPDARLAERGPPGPRRPEAGRAQPLRERPAPADAGRHLAAPGRQRARQPDRRDGDAATAIMGAGPRPQPRRAQQDPRARPARRRCRTSSA